jgi:hypothetical protein
MNGPHRRTLELALKTVGAKKHLAIALAISVEELDGYLNGTPLTHRIFIEALEIRSIDREFWPCHLTSY